MVTAKPNPIARTDNVAVGFAAVVVMVVKFTISVAANATDGALTLYLCGIVFVTVTAATADGQLHVSIAPSVRVRMQQEKHMRTNNLLQLGDRRRVSASSVMMWHHHSVVI